MSATTNDNNGNRKMNVLSFGQFRKLEKYLIKYTEQSMPKFKTLKHCAEVASEMLDFRITAANVSKLLSESDDLDRTQLIARASYGSNRSTDSKSNDLSDLQERIAQVESRLELLIGHLGIKEMRVR